MKIFLVQLSASLMFFSAFLLSADSLDDIYKLGPDSLPQDGVPKGAVTGPLTHASQVFPDTTRHYWVYVPAQYDAASPARLMVFQDGHAFVNCMRFREIQQQQQLRLQLRLPHPKQLHQQLHRLLQQ